MWHIKESDEIYENIVIFDNKYFDIDSGKYNIDKLPKIYHTSLADNYTYDYALRYSRSSCSNQVDIDKEFKRASKAKKAKEKEENRIYHEKMCHEQQVRAAQLKEAYYQKIVEQKKQELEEAELKYKEAELKYKMQVKEEADRIARLDKLRIAQVSPTVRQWIMKNTWVVKIR